MATHILFARIIGIAIVLTLSIGLQPPQAMRQLRCGCHLLAPVGCVGVLTVHRLEVKVWAACVSSALPGPF